MNDARKILETIGEFAKRTSYSDALSEQLQRSLDRLCSPYHYMAFIKSQSNYVKRVWDQLVYVSPLVTGCFKPRDREARVGVTVSRKVIKVAGEPWVKFDYMSRGTHYAHLVAFAALDAGVLDDYADAVVATDNVDAAMKLVFAGCTLLYDDTGEVSASTGKAPVFDEDDVEVVAPTAMRKKADRARDNRPLVAWHGQMTEQRQDELRRLARYTAASDMFADIAKNMPARILTSFPHYDHGNWKSELMSFSDTLFFGMVEVPDVYGDSTNILGISTPSHTVTDISSASPEFDCYRDFAEKFGGVLTIWNEMLSRSHLVLDFTHDMDGSRSRLREAGEALGIDQSVRAYLEGVPLEHVLA